MLYEENKEELESNLLLIKEKFYQDIQTLLIKFEQRCFDSKYLELIVEKWKLDFISSFAEVI